MTEFVIDIYNPRTRKYQRIWTGHDDYEMAIKMYNKPYITRHTRRLKKVIVEVLKKDKSSS